MERVNSRQAEQRMTAFKEFESYTGSLKGTWERSDYHITTWLKGDRLRHHAWEHLKESPMPLYVVWSYQTPIAWCGEDKVWHRPAVRYSPTTGKHQSRCPQTHCQTCMDMP